MRIARLYAFFKFYLVNFECFVGHFSAVLFGVFRFFIDILEKAGENEPECLIPHFSCHILRHTFATRLCEQGVNIKVIQAVLGHKDFQTTMNIYVDVTNELKEDEMNKFDEYIHMDKESLVVVND